MMAGSYVRHALATAIRVARFDRQAIAEFDHSFEGFYRSFFCIVLCAPLYAVIVIGERRLAIDAEAVDATVGAQPIPPPSLGIYAYEALIYLLQWLAFPLLMIAIVRLIGATARYVPFIVAYNWTTCIVLALTVIPFAFYLAGAISLAGVLALYYPLSVLTLVYRWRVAKDGLQIPNTTALGIVILDVLLGVFLTLAASRMGDLL